MGSPWAVPGGNSGHRGGRSDSGLPSLLPPRLRPGSRSFLPELCTSSSSHSTGPPSSQQLCPRFQDALLPTRPVSSAGVPQLRLSLQHQLPAPQGFASSPATNSPGAMPDRLLPPFPNPVSSPVRLLGSVPGRPLVAPRPLSTTWGARLGHSCVTPSLGSAEVLIWSVASESPLC